MSEPSRVSIVIDNYNYGRFLGEAIDSALAQTHPHVEVVVVDDGSTDGSRDVIARYAAGGGIVPVLKANGGMASALNAGFAASRGDVVIFLDSDDALLPTAVERAVELFRDPGVVAVHWPLWQVDRDGARTGEVAPRLPLSEGDFREATIREGPVCYVRPPTSGNAWRRSFLRQVFPIPEREFARASEAYVADAAPLFGAVLRIPEPQALYRIHGDNDFGARTEVERAGYLRELFDVQCEALGRLLARLNVDADPARWRRQSPHRRWWSALESAADELTSHVPAGGRVVLVDEGQWACGPDLRGRGVLPFIERDGAYWGPPADAAHAIAELERMRRERGATHVAFAWPAFWWLAHFTELREHLRAHHRCLLRNERLVLFELGALAQPSGGLVAARPARAAG